MEPNQTKRKKEGFQKKSRRFIPQKQYKEKLKHSRYFHNTAVFNLSKHTLTHTQLSLLSRGLGFSPTPKHIDETSTITDVLTFFRKLKLSLHFGHRQRDDTTLQDSNSTLLKQSSGWTPPIRNQALDYFQAHFMNEATKIKKKTPPNLKKEEFQAIQELKTVDHMIIKRADKGGAVVLWDKEQYIIEAKRHLEDGKTYTELPSDPTTKFAKQIEDFLIEAKKHLPDDTYEHLRPRNNAPGTFYLLPKIHKLKNLKPCNPSRLDCQVDLNETKIPGRPICSSIGTVTERISAYVDTILKPVATNVHSYVKDTGDFLEKISALPPLKDNAILVTIDVSALYTSIPHREGIAACRDKLNARGNAACHNWITLRLIHFILTKNHFTFMGKHYLQLFGTAMGTKIGPNYAIIFMAVLEEAFLKSRDLKPSIWLRFIDDIFMIWEHGQEALLEFLTELNSFHNHIKFTWEISPTSVDFLDITVFKQENGKLAHRWFKKPTDAHLYLHYQSAHPRHVIDNIPKGQFLRMTRINSNAIDQENSIKELQGFFQDRGYPKKLLNFKKEQKNRHGQRNDNANDRQRLNNAKMEEKEEKRKIIFITGYDPRKPMFNSIWEETKKFLQVHPDTRELAEFKFITAHRRAPTLGDMLTKSKLDEAPSPAGSHPCGSCYLCPNIETTTEAISSTTNFKVQIKSHINCQTPGIIYLITCTACHIQYIGESRNSANKRFRGHLQDIRENNEVKPVSNHFNKPGHCMKTKMKITLLKHRLSNHNRRKRTEEALIQQLGTLKPQGLNIKEH